MSSLKKESALAKAGIFGFKIFKKGGKLEKELIKYTDIDRVKVIELPEEVYEPVDKTKILENIVFKNVQRIFGQKIVEIVPEEDLSNFYRNFSSIQMIDLAATKVFSNLFKRGGLLGGYYDPQTNTISFKDSFLSSVIGAITHELLHAASTFYDKKRNIVFCGLSQMYINKEDKKKSETYGLAINEGYTQYLNNKYFVDQNSVTLNFFGKRYTFQGKNEFSEKIEYKEEQIIAKALNAIVGEDKMQSFYFRGDLNGLVKELEKYQSREVIYRFINYTDTLCFYASKKNVNNETVNEIKKFVNSFLFSTFVKAQKARNIDDNDQYIFFINNCLPYENSVTHDIVLDKDYLSGEVTNPLEKVARRRA